MHCVLCVGVLHRSWTNQWLEHWSWNPRDLISLPDSMAPVSFRISFNLSLLELSLIILMMSVRHLLLCFTFFAKDVKLKYTNVITSVVIAHYCSQTFWNCLLRDRKKSAGINILICYWYPWMTRTYSFSSFLKTWRNIWIMVLKYLACLRFINYLFIICFASYLWSYLWPK